MDGTTKGFSSLSSRQALDFIVYGFACILRAERGYQAVDIGRIIDEAGVSRMTICEYFPSKRASRCRSPDRPPSPFPSLRTA
ncbi:helix-turn-helix domain-containing protein [Burkholderia stagnalis]|uniref:helix-turn-helix domain-containing protein n=1 Tax=Burkholderia stagnalis TaxID=1503054 RepID=UPI0009BCDC91